MDFVSDCRLETVILDNNQSKAKAINLVNTLCDKIEKQDRYIEAFIKEENRKSRLLKAIKAVYSRPKANFNRLRLPVVPVAVKDIFHVKNFSTKAGSLLPADVLTGKEAEVVTKLKNEGTVVLGKTVTTEFAYFHPGPTKNPHNLAHTPGGSSSGSAAAVAAGFTPLALGTQTIGSISRPAAYCGVIGFKPSYARISTKGVIPFSTSVDHVGFFTSDFTGSKIIAGILCNNWQEKPEQDNTSIRFGLPDENYLQQADSQILSEFDIIIKKLKKQGFRVKKTALFSDIKEINYLHHQLIAKEFAEVHKKNFSKYKNLYRPKTAQLIQKGAKVNAKVYQKAKQGRWELRRKITELMNINEIDIWLSPAATSTAPRGLGSTGDPAMNLPWTYSGLPTLAIPLGTVNKLPFGLQFAAAYGNDEQLYEKIEKFLKQLNES
mgnify:CR=1 FL=1